MNSNTTIFNHARILFTSIGGPQSDTAARASNFTPAAGWPGFVNLFVWAGSATEPTAPNAQVPCVPPPYVP